MNSKEALNNIKNLFIGRPINPTRQFEIIERDLEILEILKTEIFNENQCFNLEDGWYDASFSLNKNQRKIIKEWLNDK